MNALFKIYYRDGSLYTPIYSVYYIDAINERFLITDKYGRFRFVNIADCELADEEDEEC